MLVGGRFDSSFAYVGHPSPAVVIEVACSAHGSPYNSARDNYLVYTALRLSSTTQTSKQWSVLLLLRLSMRSQISQNKIRVIQASALGGILDKFVNSSKKVEKNSTTLSTTTQSDTSSQYEKLSEVFNLHNRLKKIKTTHPVVGLLLVTKS